MEQVKDREQEPWFQSSQCLPLGWTRLFAPGLFLGDIMYYIMQSLPSARLSEQAKHCQAGLSLFLFSADLATAQPLSQSNVIRQVSLPPR